MLITDKAKKAWFKKNVLNFEIVHHTSTSTVLIYRYDTMFGVTSMPKKNYTMLSQACEKSLWLRAHSLKPWQVFFKYKIFCVHKKNDLIASAFAMTYGTVKDVDYVL